MPFLTEELWHEELFGNRTDLDCCIVAPYPTIGSIDASLLQNFDAIKQLVSEVRNIRNQKQLSPKEALPLFIKQSSTIEYNNYTGTISQLANITEISFVDEKPAGSVSFMVGTDEFFVTLNQTLDLEAERDRINKEIAYLQGFLKSMNTKLSNERFVQNAKPEIIAIENRKKEDAEAKIKALADSLQSVNQ